MTKHDNPGMDGDEAAFAAGVERHRRELQLHCYRMLGSFHESEDAVQETFLRAWRSRASFEGRSSLRAWLYRIATNACLDALDRRPRTVSANGEVPWLEPFPDRLLEAIPADDIGPEAAITAKETVELAFLVAIQHLPPKPRAALILRDVLGLSAKEAASILDTTVAAVNSALQRAHAGLRDHLPERRLEWPPGTDASAAERALLQRYMELSERADVHAFGDLLHDEVRFTMPPQEGAWVGRDTVLQSWIEGGWGEETFGAMRCVLTRANRQPAVAGYVRRPGDDAYRPLALDVVRIEDGLVADITTFDGTVFPWFGLPETIAP